MRKWHAALAAVSLWGFFGLQTASAQIGSYSAPQTNPHPTFSPYMNMMRGNNAAINYFGIVRPQMDMARSLQVLQQNQSYGQSGATPLGVNDPANQNNFIITGHPVTFSNTSHYFPVGGSRFTGMGTGVGGSSGTRTVNNSPPPQGYPRSR